MEQQTEKPKRRPSIEVRCPKCGMREIWHHLPKGGRNSTKSSFISLSLIHI